MSSAGGVGGSMPVMIRGLDEKENRSALWVFEKGRSLVAVAHAIWGEEVEA